MGRHAPRVAWFLGIAVLCVLPASTLAQARPPQPPPPQAAPPTALSKAAPLSRAAAAAVTTLDVVVADPAGKPIEGAFVTALPNVGSFGRWGSADRTRSTLTGREGRARLEALPRGPWRVFVHARGYADRSLPRVEAGPLSVRLEKGGIVTGTVRVADGGRPIAGARVRLGDGMPAAQAWQEQATRVESVTDAQGRFRLDGVGRSGVRVVARAAGFGSAARGDVRAGENVDLFLFPGATLSGTVRDDAGQPVAGALVRADSDGFRATPQSDVTDAQGAFTMAGISPGDYVVFARGGARAPGVATALVTPESETSVSLRLSDGGYATGQLKDGEGRPVAGRVRLEVVDGLGLSQPVSDAVAVEAAADGRFALGPLPVGSLGLGASARGYAPRRVEVAIPARGRSVDLGAIVLETGLAIRGSVRDTEGNPVVGAHVRAMSRARGESSRGEGVSEADGSFIVPGLRPAPHEVTASATGFAPARAQAEPGAAPLALVLQPGGGISGRLVDAQGTAVDDGDLEAQRSEDPQFGPNQASGRSDEGDGRFVLRDLGAGTYVVDARASGRGETSITGVRVAPGRPTDVGTLMLDRGGVVQGSVADADGNGVPGAEIHLEKDLNMQSGRLQTQTGGDGAFELRGVPPGRINVLVRHPSYATPKPVVADVDPEKEPVPVRVVLVRGARLEGRAQRRDGSPFTDGRVTVRSLEAAGAMSWAPGAIAPDGSFVVDHLPPGRVSVNLMAYTPSSPMMSGPASTILATIASQELELRENETSSAAFALRDVIVSGHVTRGGQSAAGVHVGLMARQGASMMTYSGGPPRAAVAPAGPPPLSATTREDGGFELLVFTPGRYAVWLSSAAARQSYRGRTLDVPDSERFEAEFELGDASVSGIVVDRDGGEPVSNVELFAARKADAERGVSENAGGQSGPDGRFAIAVEPGEIALSARAEQYKPFATTLTVGPGGVSDVRIELERGVAIAGRVVDDAGRPQTDVEIVATGGPSAEPGSLGYGGNAQSRADGSYRIDGLDPRASYAVAAGSPTRGFALRTGVRPGADLTLVLRPAARVAIRAVGGDGRPVKGAWPYVRSWGGVAIDLPYLGHSSTDADGRCELSVPPGELVIGIGAERVSGSVQVSVAAGETAAVEIQVKEQPAR